MLIAAAGGALYLLPALVSSRPPTTANKSGDALGYADVDARLWQDPFQAAYEHRDAVAKRLGRLPDIMSKTSAAPQSGEEYREVLAHGVGGFRQQIADVLKKTHTATRKDAGKHKLKVLAVMVNDGPYI
jgi:hypothetical protein